MKKHFLAMALLLSGTALAQPAGQKMVGLLTRATLLSSRQDCRFGLYRSSDRNETYLSAVLQGLKASKIRGLPEGLNEARSQRQELSLLRVESLAFAGNGVAALEAGLQLLKDPQLTPGLRPWLRLCLLEAARVAWRADLLDDQLKGLAHETLTPLEQFLFLSFSSERQAQRQVLTLAQAQKLYGQAYGKLQEAGDGKDWPVGSGHLVAQALAAWSELLLDASEVGRQVEVTQQLDKDWAFLGASSNPELLQAWIFERNRRLIRLRELQDWPAMAQEITAQLQSLERLKSLSMVVHQQVKAQSQQLAQDIARLATSDKELDGRGLDIMGGNLVPQEPTTGELRRQEGTVYQEWARMLLYGPNPDAQKLDKAALCLQAAASNQMLTGWTQSPVSTLDPPTFDLISLDLRQKGPGWQKRTLEMAQAAVALFDRYHVPMGVCSALTVLAEVQLAQGDSSSARDSLNRAVQTAEEHISQSGYTGRWAERFRARFRRAYEMLVQLDLDEGKNESAASLLGRLQQTEIASLRQASLEHQLEQQRPPLLRGALSSESAEPAAPGGPVGASQAVASGKGPFFRALGELRQKHPEYESLLAIRPVNYARVQPQIPPNMAVLQFFPATDSLYLFLVTNKTLKIQRVPISNQELKRRVFAYRQAIVAEFLAGRSQQVAFPEPLQQASSSLYECLIQPVEADLASYSTVAFVPTAFLSYVPFASLGKVDAERGFHPLVESKASLTLLKSSELEGLTASAPSAAGTMLALGNPDGTLPGAGQEAEQVAAIFTGSHAYLGSQANRGRVESLPQGTRILHLATHGELNGNNPMNSYLVMGAKGDPKGRLEIGDVYAMTWPKLRLVTLSACQTGLAQRDPGSEVASLADAFEVAGAQSVVATLWSVEDEGTRQLMVHFYQQIKQGKPLVVALQQSQLALLRGGTYASPFYWAPFCLYGDWR